MFYVIVLLGVIISVAQSYPKVEVSQCDIPGPLSTELTIKWMNIPNPSVNDYIIVANWFNSIHPEYGRVSVTKSTTYKYGFGQITTPIPNLRNTTLIFSYIQRNGTHSHPVANSVPVLGMGTHPQNIHVSLTYDYNAATIHWVTGKWTKHPIVVFYDCDRAYKSTGHTMVVNATTTTYSMQDLCINQSQYNIARDYFIWPGLLHSATISPLVPNTRVCYRVGEYDQHWSWTYSFKVPDRSADKISFVAWGDSGVGYCSIFNGWCEKPSIGTVERLMEVMDDVDFALHVGDISYAVGYAIRWDEFASQMMPLISRLPYLSVIGNHEYDVKAGGGPFKEHKDGFHPSWGNFDDDSHGECGVPFMKRYPGPNMDGRPWWSLDLGPIHLTAFSSEHNWTRGSVQHKFLQQDLMSVNRTKTPWLITALHRPFYTSTRGAADIIVGIHIIRELEPLFVKAGVDLSLEAHQHNFEMIDKVINGVPDSHGPAHVIIGTGGKGLEDFQDQQPKWSIYRTKTYGYLRVDATKQTLRLSLVENISGKVTYIKQFGK